MVNCSFRIQWLTVAFLLGLRVYCRKRIRGRKGRLFRVEQDFEPSNSPIYREKSQFLAKNARLPRVFQAHYLELCPQRCLIRASLKGTDHTYLAVFTTFKVPTQNFWEDHYGEEKRRP